MSVLTQIIALKGNEKSKKNIQRGKYKPYDIKAFIFLNLYVSERTSSFTVLKSNQCKNCTGVEREKAWRVNGGTEKKYHKLSGFFFIKYI